MGKVTESIEANIYAVGVMLFYKMLLIQFISHTNIEIVVLWDMRNSIKLVH